MNYFFTFLFYLSLSLTAFGQGIDSLSFSAISKQLVNQHKLLSFNEENNKEFERRENCVYVKGENFPFGCVSSFWDINWTTDFNNDSIDDIVVKIMYEGVGRGDNISEYTFKIVTLDANKKIKDIYSLYGGERLGTSKVILSIDSVKNGRIYTRCRKTKVYDVDRQKIAYLPLEFSIKNNRVEESKYPNCQLAKVDKRIFNDNVNFEIKKSFLLDEAYNEKAQEILYVEKTKKYTTAFFGCENMNILFTYNASEQIRENKSKKEVKENWLKHIDFLIKNTRYSSVLKELKTALSSIANEKIVTQGYLNAKLEISLSNNWKAYLDLAFNYMSKDDMSIKLIKSLKEEPMVWESIKRKVKD